MVCMKTNMDLSWNPSIPEIQTESDFSKVIDKASIVYIYSPQCSACIHSQPIFNTEVSKLYKDLPQEVSIYRYNAVPSENEAEIKERHDMYKRVLGIPLQHYPTILGISNQGTLVEYSGPVTEHKIMNFMRALKKT